MRVGTKERAAMVYLLTEPLTELAGTACCISEDVSPSARLNPEADGIITRLQNLYVQSLFSITHIYASSFS